MPPPPLEKKKKQRQGSPAVEAAPEVVEQSPLDVAAAELRDLLEGKSYETRPNVLAFQLDELGDDADRVIELLDGVGIKAKRNNKGELVVADNHKDEAPRKKPELWNKLFGTAKHPDVRPVPAPTQEKGKKKGRAGAEDDAPPITKDQATAAVKKILHGKRHFNEFDVKATFLVGEFDDEQLKALRAGLKVLGFEGNVTGNKLVILAKGTTTILGNEDVMRSLLDASVAVGGLTELDKPVPAAKPLTPDQAAEELGRMFAGKKCKQTLVHTVFPVGALTQQEMDRANVLFKVLGVSTAQPGDGRYALADAPAGQQNSLRNKPELWKKIFGKAVVELAPGAQGPAQSSDPAGDQLTLEQQVTALLKGKKAFKVDGENVAVRYADFTPDERKLLATYFYEENGSGKIVSNPDTNEIVITVGAHVPAVVFAGMDYVATRKELNQPPKKGPVELPTDSPFELESTPHEETKEALKKLIAAVRTTAGVKGTITNSTMGIFSPEQQKEILNGNVLIYQIPRDEDGRLLKTQGSLKVMMQKNPQVPKDTFAGDRALRESVGNAIIKLMNDNGMRQDPNDTSVINPIDRPDKYITALMSLNLGESEQAQDKVHSINVGLRAILREKNIKAELGDNGLVFYELKDLDKYLENDFKGDRNKLNDILKATTQELKNPTRGAGIEV